MWYPVLLSYELYTKQEFSFKVYDTKIVKDTLLNRGLLPSNAVLILDHKLSKLFLFWPVSYKLHWAYEDK